MKSVAASAVCVLVSFFSSRWSYSHAFSASRTPKNGASRTLSFAASDNDNEVATATAATETEVATDNNNNNRHPQQRRVFVSTPVSKYPKRMVGDCMTPMTENNNSNNNVLVLTPDMSVDESMALLLSRGLSGAPVVDSLENYALVGMVSSFDFLQKEAFEGAVLPPIFGNDSQFWSVEHVERYVKAAQRICGQRVSDVMTRCGDQNNAGGITTVTPSTTMREAAAYMTEKRLHRLPVVDPDSDQLVGILSSSDVMQDLLHIVRNLPPASSSATSSSDEEEENDKSDGSSSSGGGEVAP